MCAYIYPPRYTQQVEKERPLLWQTFARQHVLSKPSVHTYIEIKMCVEGNAFHWNTDWTLLVFSHFRRASGLSGHILTHKSLTPWPIHLQKVPPNTITFNHVHWEWSKYSLYMIETQGYLLLCSFPTYQVLVPFFTPKILRNKTWSTLYFLFLITTTFTMYFIYFINFSCPLENKYPRCICICICIPNICICLCNIHST